METFELCLTQESEGGKEDKSGPALALSAGQLRHGKLAVGKWTETLGVVTNCRSRSLSHGSCIPRGRRFERSQCGSRLRPHGRLRIDWHRHRGLGEVSFHAARGVGFHRDIAR